MEKFTLREKAELKRSELVAQGMPVYMEPIETLSMEKIAEDSKFNFKLTGKLLYIPMYLKECYGITEQEFDAWLETLPERD